MITTTRWHWISGQWGPGLISAGYLAGCLLSTAALANQTSVQQISSSTSASNGATAVNRIHQSAYQAHASENDHQQIWQTIQANTVAHGTQTTAITDIAQSALQIQLENENPTHTQTAGQIVTLENIGWGPWSVSEMTIDQAIQQVNSNFQ